MQYSWQNAFSALLTLLVDFAWDARWQTQLVDQQMPSEETQDKDDLIRTIWFARCSNRSDQSRL
jgi:hypothetical protein